MVTIKRVTSKNELRKFVSYPNKLYKDVSQFVPAFYGDDMADWDKKKNPAFEYCEAECFLAYRDGEIVGRIGAILSHKANATWNTNYMRFSQVDFIDDDEVSSALFNAVEEYAREKGCDKIQGPLGFCDMDREGMLIEGYDNISLSITYYNHPYYNTHLEKLGYKKDTDWIEYKIPVPKRDDKTVRRLKRIAEYVMKKQNLRIAPLKSRAEYKPYIKKLFELYNETYAPLYGAVKLTDAQVKKYTDKFVPLINPDYACFVMDENDNMVALGVAAPSMSYALKKCNGKLFPIGWMHVLSALKKSKFIEMYLIGVLPELQGSGINAIVLNHFIESCLKNGIEYAETGPMLETNAKILSQWKDFEKDQHKRRRCYVKDI